MRKKRWANAVILKDESVTYDKGEVIPEDNIESYFVWIPRYRYKLWNVDNTSDSGVNSSVVHEIEIEFESTAVTPSNGSVNGEWLTHPAFTSFEVNGLWVGKFETGYDGATNAGGAQTNTTESTKVIIKPDVYSWRSIQVANAFTTSYNYQRSLDSHMMKNTEWGAVAYLSHSKYGQGNKSVRMNNNSSYKTGYAATVEVAVGGTDSSVTQPWNTATGYLASTTGNITGVYDMSGGTWEYVMGVQVGSDGLPLSGSSGFNNSNLPTAKYYDVYPADSGRVSYSNRILGDATGEMGPFGFGFSSWHSDSALFVSSSYPWFNRGGNWNGRSGAGVFHFGYNDGNATAHYSFRVVLAI